MVLLRRLNVIREGGSYPFVAFTIPALFSPPFSFFSFFFPLLVVDKKRWRFEVAMTWDLLRRSVTLWYFFFLFSFFPFFSYGAGDGWRWSSCGRLLIRKERICAVLLSFSFSLL